MGIFNFLKKKKESIDTGFSFNGNMNMFGVSATDPLTIPVVLAAVKMLSEDIARVPLFVARKHSVYKEKIDHPINKILLFPNEKETAMSLKMQIVGAMILWGQSFLYVEETNGGKPISLRCVHPSFVFEKVKPKTNTSVFTINGRDFSENEILRIIAFSEYSNHPQSIIKLMSQWKNITQLSERYASSFLENMAKPSMIVKSTDPSREWSKKERDEIREDFKKIAQGQNRAGEIIVLPPKMEAVAMSMQSDDLQMINSRKFQMQHFAAVTRIPMHMLGDTSKTSYNNVHEMTISYIRFALAPIAEMIAQSLTRKMLSEKERESGLSITYDMSALYNGDPKTMNDIYKDALYAGVVKLNEYRNLLGLPSMDGGDVLFQGVKPKEKEQDKNQEQQQKKENDDDDDDDDERSHKQGEHVRAADALTDEEKLALYIEKMRSKIQKQYEAAADWDSFYKRKIDFDDTKGYVKYWDDFGSRNTDEALALTASREMSEDIIRDLSGKFTKKYKQGFEARITMSAKNKIKKIKDAADSGIIEASAAAAKLKEIIKEGSKAKAAAELVRAKNAIRRNTWIDAGVQRLRVQASGKPCEFCKKLNGIEFSITDPILKKGEGLEGDSGAVLTSTGNKYHPPFHQSCQCAILPA